MAKEIIEAGDERQPLGPYSPAVRGCGLLHIAGQLGWDYGAGGLVPGDMAAEARQAFDNLARLLADAGAGLADIVKVTVYVTDMADWDAVNAVWSEVFPTDPPARTAVGVTELPKRARIELDAVAVG